MRRTPIAIGVLSFLVVAACTRAAGGSNDTPVALASPTAAMGAATTDRWEPSASPISTEPLPSDPELRHTVELRRAMGLRSDLVWIATVAADPRHFDLGDALTVVSDGTGVALIEWGEVDGRVRTEAGGLPPPAFYYLRWRSSDTRRCGLGDVGYGVGDDGLFALPCQAGTWTIEVTVPSGDDWRPVGEGTVEVPANTRVALISSCTKRPDRGGP
ncbi:MAG: hypothetical protein WEE50_01595 [Chloroflexota bacterium]